MIQTALPAFGLVECEFGVSDDGVSWAIVVDNRGGLLMDTEELSLELWGCWFQACEHQQQTSDESNQEGAPPSKTPDVLIATDARSCSQARKGKKIVERWPAIAAKILASLQAEFPELRDVSLEEFIHDCPPRVEFAVDEAEGDWDEEDEGRIEK